MCVKIIIYLWILGEKPEETWRALDKGEEIEKSNHILDGITQKYEMKTQVKEYSHFFFKSKAARY